MRHVLCWFGSLAIGVSALAGPAGTTRVQVVLDEPAAYRADVPWLVLRIEGGGGAAAGSLRAGLLRDLDALVQARVVEDTAAADFELVVRLGTVGPAEDGFEAVTFESSLLAPDGRPLWKAHGSSRYLRDADPAPGIGRNLLDALVRSGWLRQKVDAADPPPPPPALVRRDR